LRRDGSVASGDSGAILTVARAVGAALFPEPVKEEFLVKAAGAFLLLVAILTAAVEAQETPSTPAQDASATAIDSKEAERLFLDYINNRKNLIRSCMFLGGVRVEEISVSGDVSTARIRYRIECTQEEITMPPLTRTMRENFLFRQSGEHWEILGRATETRVEPRPASASSTAPPESPSADPLDRARESIAGEILSWAVLGIRPEGVDQAYPGSASVSRKSPVLVSNENMGSVAELTVGKLKAQVFSPEALLQRTVLAGGGVWFRFEVLDLDDSSAHARIDLVAPVLPPPRPGEALTRVLSRVEADFLHSRSAWVMTRWRAVP
jgi:hypothetical protein